MKLINFLKDNKFLSLFLIISILIGTITIKDYGVAWDDYETRSRGFQNLNFVGKIFIPETIEKFTQDKKYSDELRFSPNGPIYDMAVSIVEIIFNINEKNHQLKLKHYFNYFFFVISITLFYFLIKSIFKNNLISIFSLLLFYTNPIFFFNSVVNSKDIVFLNLIIIFLFFSFKFLENNKTSFLILVGVIMGAANSLRPFGIIILLNFIIIYYIYNIKIIEQNIIYKKIISLLLIFFLTNIICLPMLWDDPLFKYIQIYFSASKYDLNVDQFFMGEIIAAKKMPIYYPWIWILVTTPISFIILMFIGLFSINKKILFQKKILIDQNFKKEKFFWLFCIGALISFVLIIFLIKPTMYNGWRHFYFIYIFIISIALYGINFLFNKFKNYKKIITIVIIIFFIKNIFWMIKNHPYQFAYFNFIAGSNPLKYFDTDHLGTSYKKQIKLISNNKNNNKIYIYDLGKSILFYSLLNLSSEERKNIIITKDIKKADYLLTNEYYNLKINNEVNKYIKKNYYKYNVIKVDNFLINVLYKKK